MITSSHPFEGARPFITLESVAGQVLAFVFMFLEDAKEWRALPLVSRHWRFVARSYRRGLRSLPHSLTSLSTLQFQRILEHSFRLKTIDLHSTRNLLNDNTLQFISANCRELRFLRLSYVPNGRLGFHSWPQLPPVPSERNPRRSVTLEAVELLWQSCPRLRSVSLSECPRLSDRSINMFSEKCTALEQLFIWDCMLGDDAVAEIARMCPKLRILSLSKCGELSDKGLVGCIQRYPYLSSLRITNTDFLTDEAFAFNAEIGMLSDLEIDNISNITSQGLCNVLSISPSLESLRLKNCKSISDAGLLQLFKDCVFLTHLSMEEM